LCCCQPFELCLDPCEPLLDARQTLLALRLRCRQRRELLLNPRQPRFYMSEAFIGAGKRASALTCAAVRSRSWTSASA
jgi:hypothetical protein